LAAEVAGRRMKPRPERSGKRPRRNARCHDQAGAGDEKAEGVSVAGMTKRCACEQPDAATMDVRIAETLLQGRSDGWCSVRPGAAML